MTHNHIVLPKAQERATFETLAARTRACGAPRFVHATSWRCKRDEGGALKSLFWRRGFWIEDSPRAGLDSTCLACLVFCFGLIIICSRHVNQVLFSATCFLSCKRTIEEIQRRSSQSALTKTMRSPGGTSWCVFACFVFHSWASFYWETFAHYRSLSHIKELSRSVPSWTLTVHRLGWIDSGGSFRKIDPAMFQPFPGVESAWRLFCWLGMALNPYTPKHHQSEKHLPRVGGWFTLSNMRLEWWDAKCWSLLIW